MVNVIQCDSFLYRILECIQCTELWWQIVRLMILCLLRVGYWALLLHQEGFSPVVTKQLIEHHPVDDNALCLAVNGRL